MATSTPAPSPVPTALALCRSPRTGVWRRAARAFGWCRSSPTGPRARGGCAGSRLSMRRSGNRRGLWREETGCVRIPTVGGRSTGTRSRRRRGRGGWASSCTPWSTRSACGRRRRAVASGRSGFAAIGRRGLRTTTAWRSVRRLRRSCPSGRRSTWCRASGSPRTPTTTGRFSTACRCGVTCSRLANCSATAPAWRCIGRCSKRIGPPANSPTCARPPTAIWRSRWTSCSTTTRGCRSGCRPAKWWRTPSTGTTSRSAGLTPRWRRWSPASATTGRLGKPPSASRNSWNSSNPKASTLTCSTEPPKNDASRRPSPSPASPRTAWTTSRAAASTRW